MTEPYDRTVDISGSDSASQGHDRFRQSVAGEQDLGGVPGRPGRSAATRDPGSEMNFESKVEVESGKTERPSWLLAQIVRREG